MPYSWLQFSVARQQLAERLANSGLVRFWTDAECGVYIIKALRMFNALTFTWKTDFVFDLPLTSSVWNSLGLISGSPRLRTLTDNDAFVNMEYHLLEPPTGGTWTGTSQFNIADLSQALQRRRDEMIKVSNCNQSLMTGIPLTPDTRRTVLPDTVIDVTRVRYMPIPPPGSGFGEGGFGEGGFGGSPGNPNAGFTLFRDDVVALEFYEDDFWQAQEDTPQTFMVSSEAPLTFDVDIPPTLPGTYEAVVLQSGTPFDPPAATLLGVPDDYAWVLEWGALSDVLGRESESTDRQRADYCLKRYQDGLNLMQKTPWIMLAKVDGQAVTIDAMDAADNYMPEWDSDPSTFGPCLISVGIDFFAAPTGHGIGVTVLGNAPIPVEDDDQVQVSRSNWDTVLDLAQVFACFKMGGDEFQQALEIEKRAILACAMENSRLRSTGSFSDIIVQRGQIQDFNQNRYNDANQKAAAAAQ